MKQREAEFKGIKYESRSNSIANNTSIQEQYDVEDILDKVKGGQKQIKLEEKFKTEVQMREKEKMEQSSKQILDLDFRKSFGRSNGIVKEKAEEKGQLWQAQQDILKLQKEIEKLNIKVKQYESQDISSNNLIKQAQVQASILEKQNLEEKEQIIQKIKLENQQLQVKVAEQEQQKQKLQEQIEQQKLAIQVSLQKANSSKGDISGELTEKIQQLNDELSNITQKFEEYKAYKERETQQFVQNFYALKNNLNAPPAPQIPGFNIPQAPSIPGLDIPQAPPLPGFGVPQAPNIFGLNVPLPPVFLPGIPQAPNFNNIPPPPPILNGVPQAPNLSGIPQAPTLAIPGIPPPPILPGMGPPPPPNIPGFGIPQAPPLPGMAPLAPQLPGFGPPIPPAFNIPGIPPMAPMLPGMVPQMQQGVKQKKNPGISMKGVNWSVLKYADIQGTIWEKVQEEKIPLEEDYLKQEFCQKATVSKIQNLAQQIKGAASKKVTLLTMERQQSVLIILGKIKMKGQQVGELLYNCDLTKLTFNLVNSLLASLPNEQEMTAVQAYDGDIENLGDAEKYFKALEQVNGYEERLQALKFKYSYPEAKDFLISKLELLTKFFDQIQNDNKINIILENALAVGNYMNGTGFKGGAWGFKISNIDKMTEVKSFDGKLNLLMYLVNRIEKQEEKEIIQVDEDLKTLEECCKTPVGQLIAEITDFKRGIKMLEKAMKVQTTEEQDKIKELIEPFYIVIQHEVSEFEQKVKSIESRYKNIAEFFCEDPRKVPSDEFAKQILLFKKACIQAKNAFKNLKR